VPDRSLSDALDEARDRVLIDNTAQAVHKELQKLENQRSLYSRRWIWELLQNARDAAPSGGSLVVGLTVTPDQVSFRHNGAPFTEEEIAHLIYHGTTKQRSQGSIGQFGSGFLTTHLISTRVTVRGVMRGGHRFEFVLNREGGSPEVLSSNMKASWEEFKASLRAESSTGGPDFTTEYIYPVARQASNLVSDGVTDLERLSPYVLAFNPVLSLLTIHKDGQANRSQKIRQEHLADGIVQVSIERHEGADLARTSVILAHHDDLSVAVLIRDINGHLALDLDPRAPKIFVAFPLFGTHDFCFPGVINCERFEPTEERDGIFLGVGDSPANRCNQQLMERACELAIGLLTFIVQKEWKQAHVLGLLGELKDRDWLNRDWYRELVKKRLVSPLRSLPIMLSASDTFVAPATAWIPFPSAEVPQEALWNLAASLRGGSERLPSRDQAADWARIIDTWANFLDTQGADLPEALTADKLTRHIATMGNVHNLRAALKEGSDPIEWLNQLYDTMIRAHLTAHFGDLSLLPDQSGQFKKLQQLKKDEGIDSGLKDIAEALGCKVKTALLHNDVRSPAVLDRLHPLTESELLTEAIAILKKDSRPKTKDPAFREANVALFAWIVNHGQLDRLEGFPALTEDPDQILPLTPAPQDQEDVPLAPPACWPEPARDFAEIFPRRFTLAAAYHSACPQPDVWIHLAEQGLMRTSPLQTTEERIKYFLPDEPLPDTDKRTSHEATEARQVTTLAFLKRDDIGLIDTARKSKSRAVSLLRFLISFVLEHDHQAFEALQTECVCGVTHRYYRAAWLGPLKHRSWVPLAANKSTLPTPESLASLLEDNEELLHILSAGNPARLMQAIGVSASDLMLRSVAKDEDARLSLITSVAEMFTAVGKDTDKVRAIAEEIKHNPELLRELEERKETREKIRRNQSVGQIVEELLRSALNAEGLTVTRTGVGSDFEVENDVTQNDQEVWLEISKAHRSYLLEVKATTQTTVRMTVTQAETATREKARFILCIVRLDGPVVTEDRVLKGARFVSDIGVQTEPLWKQFENLQHEKSKARARVGDIEIEISESETRFKVGLAIWEKGKSFEEAVTLLKSSDTIL
jgi:hypothetical protein